MEKLFEKLITFVIVILFTLVSYTIFNITEIEYKVKSSKLLDTKPLVELDVPVWLKEHTICENFKILKTQDYGLTKCNKKKETVYLKDYDSEISFEQTYLYEMNMDKSKIYIYTKEKPSETEKLIEDIKEDFAYFLGVGFEYKKENEHKDVGTFNLIKKPKKKNSFLMIKNPKN